MRFPDYAAQSFESFSLVFYCYKDIFSVTIPVETLL